MPDCQYFHTASMQTVDNTDVGKIKVTAILTEDVMPDVVCLPHGWGHHRAGMKISTASAHPGVSVNDITLDSLIDELSGNAVLNGVPVEIEKSTRIAM